MYNNYFDVKIIRDMSRSLNKSCDVFKYRRSKIQNVIYRIRVRIVHNDNENHFVNMNEFFNDFEKIRKQ